MLLNPFTQSPARIAVLGLGYVGLPLAVAFAGEHDVVGFDIDAQRVAELQAGEDRTREVSAEGLAAARPVVGTAVGVEGIGFRPGEHGLVAEDPREQAAALDALLADPARAQRMGTAGRELASSFRWPRALAAIEATYAEWATAARKFERGLPITP